MTIHKGTIEGFKGSRDSGIGHLIISGVPVACENPATVRALESCFGDVVGPGHTVLPDGGHVGEEIYYSTDSLGLLEGFTPAGDAPEELVQEYERQGKPKRRRKTRRDSVIRFN